MKKTLLMMFILMAAFVIAAPALTSLSLQGNAGTIVQGTVTLSELENDTLITVESTNLLSGSNSISNSNILITQITSIAADVAVRQYTVKVHIG